jgi:ABC-type transport system involved in multi-copper enzyme maturation permease subunit
MFVSGSFWNKALLWKEWRQNRGKFWMLFLVMAWVPIGMSILSLVMQPFTVPAWGGDPHQAWSHIISLLVQGHASPFWAFWSSFFLGVTMLGQERTGNTIEFLVTTPVSRKAIISAKFFMGAGVILLMMLIIGLYMILMPLFLPALYTIHDVMAWWLPTTGVQLAIFGVCFAVSTLSGRVISTYILSMIVLCLPLWMGNGVASILRTIYHFNSYDHASLASMFEHWGTMMFLPSYLFIPGAVEKTGFLHVLAFLLVTVVSYILACWLFERNPLENNGQTLVFGNSLRVAQIGSAIFIAFFLGDKQTLILQGGWGTFFLFAVIGFLVTYFIWKVIFLLLRRWGYEISI